ncbi:hypothetical protein [Pedobacter sp.]|uniref:hypothetical protein n=1 Tax=Pedobacter sp. TaxID=1411316 RepID=UPI003C62387A
MNVSKKYLALRFKPDGSENPFWMGRLSYDRVLPMAKNIAANSRTALAHKHQNCFTEKKYAF